MYCMVFTSLCKSCVCDYMLPICVFTICDIVLTTKTNEIYALVLGIYVTNLGGNMARFTQFPIMITRSTSIYEIISPGAAGSSIYV